LEVLGQFGEAAAGDDEQAPRENHEAGPGAAGRRPVRAGTKSAVKVFGEAVGGQ
jgi:hypothetical protein